MAASKVACPKCSAILRSAKPIPDGTPVKCPQCQFAFRAPAQVAVAAGVAVGAVAAGAVAAGAAQPGTNGHAERVSAGAPRVLPSIPYAAPPAAVAAVPAAAASSGLSPAKRLGLVLGGAAAVLLIGTVTIIACLSGGKPVEQDTKNASENGENNFVIPEPKTKATILAESLIEMSAEDQKIVDGMIAKGVEYLKKTQGPEGSWGGNNPVVQDNYVAFGALTLLECGVPANDPAVQKAAEYARRRMPFINRTYPAALFILFFDKLGDPQDEERIGQLAMRLVGGQLPQGGWTYTLPVHNADEYKQLTEFFRKMGRRSGDSLRRTDPELLKSLPPKFGNMGVLNTPPNAQPQFFQGGGDNSNTQFALLALWAARRHALPVEPSLDLVVRRFRNSQFPDGSFKYAGNNVVVPLPTMTCAGLLGLAVGFGMEEKQVGKGPSNDPGVQNAIQHLGKFVGQPAPNPEAPINMSNMYYMWSLERVAVLYQLKTIAGKEWYQWGYTMLRRHQKADGSWFGGQGPGTAPLVDTCFALLFLKRVNLAKDLTDKLAELDAAPVAAVPPPVAPLKE